MEYIFEAAVDDLFSRCALIFLGENINVSVSMLEVYSIRFGDIFFLEQ